MLIDPIVRLAGLAISALQAHLSVTHLSVTDLSVLEWVVLVLVIAFMAYVEGYRGFQRSFSPRTAARVFYLYQSPSLLAGLLAPLFCMGFFQATRRPLVVAWVGTSLIILLVISLRYMPQPWRAMVDVGVVVGLSWGLLSFWASLWRCFAQAGDGFSPEVPGTLMARRV
jgi:hypothetical protein